MMSIILMMLMMFLRMIIDNIDYIHTIDKVNNVVGIDLTYNHFIVKVDCVF